MKDFYTICKKLKLKLSDPSIEDLNKLIQWCETFISTDYWFEGDLKQRFDAYKDFATRFFKEVEPHVLMNKLTDPVPAFKGLSSLEFIVSKGLNGYLKSLNPSSEQINMIKNEVSLLQRAASYGHLHTTKELLSMGAKPEEKSSKGEPLLFTTLMLPIAHDGKMMLHKQSIYTLLSSISKKLLQERNELGDTILHLMALYGYDKLIVQALKTDLKKLAYTANNLIHYPIHSAILNDQTHCVKHLIALDGVEQLIDAHGRNALHYAAKYGNANMVKICLNSSISKESVNNQNQTPLILATIANNTQAVEELLAFGVEINSKDAENRSALHYAVESDNAEIVKLLLESPMLDVNICDGYSQNPLDLIQEHTPNGALISNLLIEKGATPCKQIGLNNISF